MKILRIILSIIITVAFALFSIALVNFVQAKTGDESFASGLRFITLGLAFALGIELHNFID